MSGALSVTTGDREQEAGGPIGPLAAIQAEQAVHGAMLRRILQLLQAEPEQDGPDLGAMLERLIAEIERNTRAVIILSGNVTTLGQEMPARIVEAIGEAHDPDRSLNTESRRKS